MGMITTKEVAERVGKGQRAIQALITKGHLPAVKLGRDWFVDERNLRLIENIKPGPKPSKRKKKNVG
jgi:excisionase family DNA binding protein